MSSITLNTPMDSLVRSCDYLFSTTTDGEYVFYFINQIEILTTSTVRLMVTLDVWQTYHLRMTLLPSFVERCHVPRWKSTNIPSKEVVSEPLGNYESTVIKEENEGVVNAFLDDNKDFTAEAFAAGNICAEDGMYTFWPNVDGTDGFFAAKLRKKL